MDTANTYFTSLAITDDTPMTSTNENSVETAPPPYQSNDIHSKFQSRMSIKNDRNCQPSANIIVTHIPSTSNIQSHLAWSIINAFCCCWCFGFIALFYSLKTQRLRKEGHFQAAIEASANAKCCNMFTTIFTVILIFFSWIIYYLLCA
ncbi:hypothetical protein I4U23_020053 [Adineta vaga]|nr:hypothetical protein I4U23_020053 [Adineta vaga]